MSSRRRPMSQMAVCSNFRNNTAERPNAAILGPSLQRNNVARTAQSLSVVTVAPEYVCTATACGPFVKLKTDKPESVHRPNMQLYRQELHLQKFGGFNRKRSSNPKVQSDQLASTCSSTNTTRTGTRQRYSIKIKTSIIILNNLFRHQQSDHTRQCTRLDLTAPDELDLTAPDELDLTAPVVLTSRTSKQLVVLRPVNHCVISGRTQAGQNALKHTENYRARGTKH